MGSHAYAHLTEADVFDCPSGNLLQLTHTPATAPKPVAGPFLRATEEPAPSPFVFDLSRTTPTLLPDALRAAADQALALAADPLNLLDDNPFIAREWSAVALELSWVAASLERRVFALLFAKTVDRADPAPRRSTSSSTARVRSVADRSLRHGAAPVRNTQRRPQRLLTGDVSFRPFALCSPIRAWAMVVTLLPITADVLRRLCQFG